MRAIPPHRFEQAEVDKARYQVWMQASRVGQLLECQPLRIPLREDDRVPFDAHDLPPVMTSRGLKSDVAASFSNSSRSSAVSFGGTIILSLTYRSPHPPPR